MASLEAVTRLSEPSIQGARTVRELVQTSSASLAQSKHHHEHISNIHPQLAFLLEDNQRQIQVCRRLESNLQQHLSDMETTVKARWQEAQDVQREMAMVIELLKNREVVEKEFRSPNLPPGNNPTGETKHTLYDHIDQDAVDVVDRAMRECLDELRELAEADRDLCAAALSGIASIEIPAAEDISVTWAGVQDIGGLVEESQAVVDEIAQDSRSMDRHCDQLRETVRELEAEGGVLSIADYNVLLRDTNEIPAIIEDMRECLGQVQRRSEETYVRYLQYSAFYADSRGQFDAIAGVSGIASRYVEAAADAQVRFERLLAMADGFLSDMWGLVSWYRNFHSSYDGLIVEVQRRRHVQKEMHAVVEDMRSRLEAMYMEEVRERARFVDRSGMYLPSDLCPFIQDPPVMFVVEEDGVAERLASVQSHETRYSKNTASAIAMGVDSRT